MSGTYTLDIFCDHREEGGNVCGQWEHGTTSGHPPAMGEARAVVAESGWVRRYGPSSCGYDLCPDHAAEVPGETFPDWRSTRSSNPRSNP